MPRVRLICGHLRNLRMIPPPPLLDDQGTNASELFVNLIRLVSSELAFSKPGRHSNLDYTCLRGIMGHE